jgi:uncharacterized protein YjbI with pentapeptide repeats
MNQRLKTFPLFITVVVVVGGLLFVLEETIRFRNTGLEGKSLWNWMELLIIPLFLVLGAFYLESSQRAVEHKIATARIEEDRQLAEQRISEDQWLAEKRAKLEREIAADRQQEAAFQTYLDRMGELLLEKKLRTTKVEEVRDLARTRTISVMRVLDPKRNNLVIQFLREAKLIFEENSILKGANLESVNLKGANLKELNLQGADLQKAYLRGAHLVGANLQNANLQDAYLESAYLDGQHLEGVNLQDARLQFAKLVGAHLERANLRGANLRGAHLRDAHLEGADLRGANLKEAKVSDEQLATTILLKGATMPDGTIHD